MEIYQAIELDTILQCFVSDLRHKIIEYDYYLDPVKKVVVFRIVAQDTEEENAVKNKPVTV